MGSSRLASVVSVGDKAGVPSQVMAKSSGKLEEYMERKIIYTVCLNHWDN